MITIKKLGFSYGSYVVLKDISMNLEEGRIYGLLGENGVGKTTLLTLLAGLKKNQEGSLDVDGYNPFDRKPSFLSSVYYLPDEVPAPKRTTIEFGLDKGKYWENFDADKYRSVLKVFDINENMRMDHMSYGQLKKTYISFSLACNTKYLLMDEPTNGLDIPSKGQFRKAVSKYTREDSTLVISTHQARDLEAIIDPIIILDHADVLLNATVQEISEKLYFDYTSTEADPEAFYSEMVPGGNIQVLPNTTGTESKVNIEALFSAVLLHKEEIKNMFNK